MLTAAGSFGFCRRMRGMKKLLHADTNVYTAMTDIPGMINGRTTCRNDPHLEIPSIQAASSSSFGTASMNDRATQVANGRDVAVRNHTVQNFELIKLADTKRSYVGIMSAMIGNAVRNT